MEVRMADISKQIQDFRDLTDGEFKVLEALKDQGFHHLRAMRVVHGIGQMIQEALERQKVRKE